MSGKQLYSKTNSNYEEITPLTYIQNVIDKNSKNSFFQLDVPKWIKRVFINYFETNKDNINTINSEIASIKSKNSEQDSSISSINSEISSIKSRLDALETKWLWKKI